MFYTCHFPLLCRKSLPLSIFCIQTSQNKSRHNWCCQTKTGGRSRCYFLTEILLIDRYDCDLLVYLGFVKAGLCWSWWAWMTIFPKKMTVANGWSQGEGSSHQAVSSCAFMEFFFCFKNHNIWGIGPLLQPQPTYQPHPKCLMDLLPLSSKYLLRWTVFYIGVLCRVHSYLTRCPRKARVDVDGVLLFFHDSNIGWPSSSMNLAVFLVPKMTGMESRGNQSE